MFRSTTVRSAAQLHDKLIEYKAQIKSRLEALRVHEKSIKKMLDAFDKIPAGQLQAMSAGALAFLTELTDKESHCEEHYRHSDHLAEFFCTLTNIGFFAVGFYYRDYAVLLAGTFSLVSHAIPLKRLNELDKLAAVAAVFKILYNYDVLLTSPATVAAGVTALTVGAIDLGVRRGKLKPLEDYRGAIHSAWHLAAAFTSYQFHQAQAVEANVINSALGQTLQHSIVQPVLDHAAAIKIEPWLKIISDNLSNITPSVCFLKQQQ